MNWAQTKRRCLRNRGIGLALAGVVLVGCLIPLLKHFYVAASTKHLFSPMFFGLGNFAVTVIREVWWVPGIQVLWQHVSLPNFDRPTDPSNMYWLVLLGLTFIGGRLMQSSRTDSQTMRSSSQQAQEYQLRQEVLGYPQDASSQSASIVVTGGTVYGHLIGGISGPNAEVNYTYNDLTEIRTLVNAMHTYRRELDLTPQQCVQFESQLRAIREQLRAQTPNHSRLHESLLSLRHMAEAGAAHMLVGHWRDIVHALQRLTGP
jgi:hypothetical protein